MPTLHSSSMLVNLSIGMFSPNKKDKRVTREVLAQHQASDDAGRFTKAILPKEALSEYAAVESEARKWLATHSLPWTDEGSRILPTAEYFPCTEKMRAFRQRAEAARDAFLARYDDYIAERKVALNGMFNAADYPDKDVVRARFYFKVDFLPLPNAADFRVDVPEEELNALQTQVDARLSEARQNATRDLLKRLAEPVAAMVERLSDPEHKFRDSLVGNLKDIVKLIPHLNIGEDPQLEAFRQRIQNELVRWSPDTLRHSQRTRSSTAAAAQKILDQMNACMGQAEPAPQFAPDRPTVPAEDRAQSTARSALLPPEPDVTHIDLAAAEVGTRSTRVHEPPRSLASRLFNQSRFNLAA